jgi:hypothetical protein
MITQLPSRPRAFGAGPGLWWLGGPGDGWGGGRRQLPEPRALGSAGVRG